MGLGLGLGLGLDVLDARAWAMAEHIHTTHVRQLRLADVVDEVARDDIGRRTRGPLVPGRVRVRRRGEEEG